MRPQNLETAPLTEVPREPMELLDKTRYFKASRVLAGVSENIAVDTIARLTDIVARRGTPVKPFFDDAASNDHSAKMYGHVTVPQVRNPIRAPRRTSVQFKTIARVGLPVHQHLHGWAWRQQL